MNKELETIADEMIDGSEGAFYLYEPEEYLALDAQDQQHVMNIVWDYIDSCGACGWYFHVDGLSEHEKINEPVCWRCYDDLDEEE